MSLLNYAFAAYEPIQLLNEQGGIASADVFSGEVDSLRLQSTGPINIVVPRGRKDDVLIDLKVSPYYTAPIEVGQAVGLASLSLDGKSLIDVPLVAMSSIKEGGLWKRFKDGVRLKFREW